MYKIGLTYKRQEIFRDDIYEKMESIQKNSFERVTKDLNCLTLVIAQVSEELAEHTNKQRGFRD